MSVRSSFTKLSVISPERGILGNFLSKDENEQIILCLILLSDFYAFNFLLYHVVFKNKKIKNK